ncbi:acetyl-CoA carboxylase carboxyl transferase subunit alpha, partial [Lactobacillus delbrueckii subsp. lactis]|nr:acetyl-CoA carboxylase carboxyl transferase subunit alpha [Lactobacillus delbrueckii subsp. lactis]
FSFILLKNTSQATKAAELLGLTPESLLKGQVIEGVIKQEGSKSAQCREISRVLEEELAKLQKLPVSSLLNRRYERFRKF